MTGLWLSSVSQLLLVQHRRRLHLSLKCVFLLLSKVSVPICPPESFKSASLDFGRCDCASQHLPVSSHSLKSFEHIPIHNPIKFQGFLEVFIPSCSVTQKEVFLPARDGIRQNTLSIPYRPFHSTQNKEALRVTSVVKGMSSWLGLLFI